MRAVKRYRHLSAYHCTLSVLNILLFTVQLSYKFYLFASQPTPVLTARLLAPAASVNRDKALPDLRSHRIGMLDKRYLYEYVYIWPDARVAPSPLPAGEKTEHGHVLPVWDNRSTMSAVDRGPPALIGGLMYWYPTCPDCC